MSAQMLSTPETLPAFCEGIQYFADSLPEIDRDRKSTRLNSSH